MAAATAMATLSNTTFSRRTLRRQLASSFRAIPNVGQSLLGIKAKCGSRITMIAMHKVKLLTPEGPLEFECQDDVYIVDQDEEMGFDLPYSCRVGCYSSCAGKILEGEVDQVDGSFLDDDQMGGGFVLTFVAYPQSDVVIETHKEEELTA